MNIHEYQAKEILKKYNITVAKSIIINNVNDVDNACNILGGNTWALKAQIHSGARAKSGGVIICDNINKVKMLTAKLLGNKLVTTQTAATGLPVNKLLLESLVKIDKELYLSILVDRNIQKIIIIATQEGGIDIEQLAQNNPKKIIKLIIDIQTGLTIKQAIIMAKKLMVDENEFSLMLLKLYDIFIDKDASLIEINPLVISNGKLIALDCKMEFDDNALYKHIDIKALHDDSQENSKELVAKKYGLSYVELDGDVGCMVNGAGLAMATMDLIKYYGKEPLNFLDVGGNINSDRVVKALELIQQNNKAKAIFINIFGGIVRCDLIANGIVEAVKKSKPKIPIIIRLEGTNADIAFKILNAANINIISENNLTLAAKLLIGLTK